MSLVKINGNVKDTQGEPLLGVNIFPVVEGKNLQIGTITDRDGNFDWETDAINAETTIKFSYLGMKPMTFPAKELKNKQITMLDAIDELNEVVVVAKRAKTEKFSLKQKRIMAGAGLLTVAALLGLFVYKKV